MNNSDVNGEIFISPNNMMTAKYKLVGQDNSEVLTEITAYKRDHSDASTEISIRVIEEYDKETIIDVKYRNNDDVLVEIQPIGHQSIPVEIEVKPHNKMWALYEVQEPPKVTDILNPIQDSFTRQKTQYQAINYGKNNSLMVGRYGDEIYRSFIQFDFGTWNPQFIIIESKLRLYYSGTIPVGSKLELLTVDKQWTEDGITHLNRPYPLSIIVDDYIDNTSQRYIEFEFTQIVIDWIKHHTNNYGFMVRLSNESTDNIVTFKSRESYTPPELLITYYDSRVYSTGRKQIPIEIFVWNTGNIEAPVEITVDSVIRNSDILTELYVHRYEVPHLSSHDVEITVTKPKIDTEITISLNDEDAVLTEISARSELQIKLLDVELSVTRPVINTEIFVAYLNELDTEITVKRQKDSDILTEISVNRDYFDSEIYVKYRNDIEVEIEVQQDKFDERFVEIIASRPQTVVEIVARVGTENDIDTELSVRAIDESDRLVEISISRPEVLTEITVVETSDIPAEIFIKYADDVITEITVTIFNDVLTEIDVVRASLIDTIITVSRPDTLAVITVPYWKENDVLTEILPRILLVSDKYTEIVVRGKGGAYAFII